MGTVRPMEELRGAVVLKRLVPRVFTPWTAMAVGIGILAVALPLYLLELGASFTATSIVLGAAGLGALVAAVPAGDAIARWGERPALIGALAIIALGIALTSLSEAPIVLGALQLAVGAAATAMRLANLTFITKTVSPKVRGRANSTLGGIRRFGSFVGPLLAGVLIDAFGFATTFVISAAITAAGLAPLFTTERLQLEDNSTESDDAGVTAERPKLREALRRHGALLLQAGSGPVLIMTARRGRAILLPLVAAALDVSATTVGVIVAIGTGADLLLFPVAGWLMDHFGRLRAIGPAFMLMAAGLVTIAFVDTAFGVIVAGTLIGVGNGLSAGTMMTLAGDVAPREATSQFIAGFSAMQEIGQLAGPLAVGIIADAAGLGTAAVVLAALLVLGVGLIYTTVGETSHRQQ